MNFFGVGPLELIVILVVALVFVGPERLPRLAADLARTIREIRRYTSSFAAEFNDVVREFERDTEGDRGQWKDIGQGLSEATKSVTDAFRGARDDAESAGTNGTAAKNGSTVTSDAPSGASSGVAASAEPPEWREIAPRPPAPTNGDTEQKQVEDPR